MGVETDTFKFKIGNGSTAWNALQYASSTSSYADSDVDVHLNTSTAASGEYLSWNGTDYSWDSVSAGATQQVATDGDTYAITDNNRLFVTASATATDTGYIAFGESYNTNWNSGAYDLHGSGIGKTLFNSENITNKIISNGIATGVVAINDIHLGTRYSSIYTDNSYEITMSAGAVSGGTLGAVNLAIDNVDKVRVKQDDTTISNSLKLTNIPTSDPSTANEIWNDNGALVFSGSTAYTDSAVDTHLNVDSATSGQFLSWNGTDYAWDSAGGGGLDSAAVAALIDSDLQNPTILTIGSSSSRIAIGSGASTGNFRAIGIGEGATATGTDAVAVGYNTLADGSTSVAMGNGADAGGGSAVAIGSNSNASNTQDVAIGLRANSTGGSATAIGSDADATGSRSTAIGHSSQSTAANTTTLGWGANANVTNSTAIGYVSNASGTKSSSLGTSANASGDYSIAIGADTTASGNNSISISAGTSSFTNSNVNGIDIRTSDSASIHYSQDSDFVFGAGVTMTDLVSTGATIVFNNLPTSDPVNAGQLWNDAGTLKVSAG